MPDDTPDIETDAELTAQEKAYCLSSLGRVMLRAIEIGDLAARLEAMEAVLKIRKNGEANP